MLVKMFHILFAAWMILASGGYALFEQICHCTGNTDITLTAAHHCHTDKAIAADREDHKGSCCAHDAQESIACALPEDEGCCRTEKLVFLKTDDFTSPQGAKESSLTVIELSGPDALVVNNDLIFEEQFIFASVHGPPLIPDVRHIRLLYTGAFHSSLS